MGERTTGVDDARLAAGNGAGGEGDSPRKTVRELEAQVVELRDELGELIGELDRRRHAAFDVRRQLRRHAREVALTGLALVSVAAGFVWLGAWRARRRRSLDSRAQRLQRAMSRMIDRPERVAAEPTVPMKIVTAAASAAVAALIKKLLDRAVQQAADRHRLAASPRPTPAQARPRFPAAA